MDQHEGAFITCTMHGAPTGSFKFSLLPGNSAAASLPPPLSPAITFRYLPTEFLKYSTAYFLIFTFLYIKNLLNKAQALECRLAGYIALGIVDKRSSSLVHNNCNQMEEQVGKHHA